MPAVLPHGFRSVALTYLIVVLVSIRLLLLFFPRSLGLATGARLENVDRPGYFHILVVQVFSPFSLDAFADGLSDRVLFFVHELVW